MRLIEAFKEYRESKRDTNPPSLTLLSDAMKAARQDVGASTRIPFQGTGANYHGSQQVFSNWGAWDSWLNGKTGSKIDYATEIGDLSLSRLTAAAVRWVAKNLSDARFQVVELDGDNKEKEIEDHQLSRLFKRPNKYYSGAALLRGFALSWILHHEGYFIVYKNQLQQPVEMWYEPYWSIEPVFPSDGSEFISHYRIKRNGKWIDIDPEDKYRTVFVVRDGINPDTRQSFGGLMAAVKDIYTEEQASRFEAQLLKHGLVPPIVVSLGDKDRPFTGDIQEHASTLERKMTGDQAGKPFVTNDAVNVQKLGFDYSSVGMKETREMAEAAFCSVIGIHAESLNFSVAGRHSTYNNVREYRRGDYQDYIKPLHSMIAEEADVQLLPDYGDRGRVRCQWDYSKVDLLQPNRKEEADIAISIFKARGTDQAEFREAIGYKYEDKHKDVYYPVPSSNITISPIGPEEPDPMPEGVDTEFGANGGVKPS